MVARTQADGLGWYEAGLWPCFGEGVFSRPMAQAGMRRGFGAWFCASVFPGPMPRLVWDRAFGPCGGRKPFD
jgi:hypothetical protein